MTIDAALSRTLAQALPEAADLLAGEWTSSGVTAIVSADAAERARRALAPQATLDDLMLRLVPVASALARPVTSGFAVGAVVRGPTGALYLGANWETPGGSLALTMHAEQAAVAAAMMRGEQGLTMLAVSSAPCGMCRQFLCELVDGLHLPILVQGRQPTTLGSLLPDAFGPADLGVTSSLLAHPSASLRVMTSDDDPLTASAVGAASRSYAPYTRAPSGVAVETRDGCVVAGSYIESAAFNPSLAPVLVALAELRYVGRHPADVARATLVEVTGATITQSPLTAAVLAAVCPEALMRHVHVAVSA